VNPDHDGQILRADRAPDVEREAILALWPGIHWNSVQINTGADGTKRRGVQGRGYGRTEARHAGAEAFDHIGVRNAEEGICEAIGGGRPIISRPEDVDTDTDDDNTAWSEVEATTAKNADTNECISGFCFSMQLLLWSMQRGDVVNSDL